MEELRLIAMSAAALLLLAALGSAPALWLADGFRSRLALAPALGLAIASCLMNTLSIAFPVEVTAWLVAAAALLSLAFAARAGRGALGAELREVALPTVIALLGIALALAPALGRGSGGPIALASGDALIYTEGASYARAYDLGDDLPPGSDRTDPWLVNGRAFVEGGYRNAVIDGQAAVGVLTGSGDELANLPLLAVLFGLVPLSVWACARNLGARSWPAAFGACFGLSAAIGLLVADVTFANLAGLALGPLAILSGARAVADGGRRRLVLAGLLLAGLVTAYPEFGNTYVLTGILGGGVALLERRRPRDTAWSDWLRPRALRAAGIAGIAIAATPVAVFKALQYFRALDDLGLSVDLPRNIHLDTVGSWLFGLQYVYELARFDQLSTAKAAFAILLPIVLAAIVLLGLAREPRRALAVLAAPIAASIGLAAFVYLRYDSCEYCMWKSATFALPFVAAGLALGLQELAGVVARLGGPLRPAARVALAGIVAVALAGLVRGDVELARATYRSPALIGGPERELTGAVEELQGAPRVLLEGNDSTAVPGWTLPAAFYLSRQAGGARTLFDAAGFASFVLLPSLPESGYYSPRYDHVVTLYPGVESDRRPIGRFGQYALMRRAPIDVAVMRTGYSVDPDEGAAAVPWLQGPFELWISSPRAVEAALRIRLRGPQGGAPLRLAVGGRRLFATYRGPGLCANLRLRRGRTVIDAAPLLVAEAAGPDEAPLIPRDPDSGIGAVGTLDSRLREKETDPIKPPAKLAAIAAISARPGRC